MRYHSRHGRALFLLALAAVVPSFAQAQGSQSLPGLVVTVPPSAPQQPQPEARPAPKAAPAEKSGKARSSAPAKSKSAALSSEGSGKRSGGQSIAVLVNDDPITGYEVEQRMRLMALGANVGERAQENFKRLIQQDSTNQRLRSILQETIQANPGKSREQVLAAFEERKKEFALGLQRQAMESAKASMLPTYRKGALDELIEERLKLQEAARGNVSVDDAQVEEIIRGIAERNKMNTQQFAQHLRGMGADIDSMKARFKATLAWNQVVRRRFGAQVSVSQREIDNLVSSSATGETDDEVELQLHRITLSVPGNKVDQRVMARRLEDAEKIMRGFKGCNTTANLAKAQDAKFDNLGSRKPSTIPEPTRSLLLNAKDGEMVPPNMSAQGVELYAVCGRKVTKGDDKKRDQVAAELQQKEFEVLARRHLRDLRQDAHIEYR